MRARLLWPVLVLALLIATAVSVAFAPGSRGPLDPSSSASAGSKALATVLRGYGVRVHTSHDASSVSGRVVVTDPDDYTDAELAGLADRADLVLLGGGPRVLSALGAPAQSFEPTAGTIAPSCAWAGARAAGAADFPAGTRRMSVPIATSCYGGAVVVAPRWVWLGSARLVRNDTVSRRGLAALAVNAISADRTVATVTWLLPGTGAATEQAAPSTWALFPGGAHRAVVWLAVVGLLLAAWQGRRLGRVVREPLPVVVRAAEAVEGHGRLYRRAGARERAGAALRTASLNRLGARLDVAPGLSAAAVCAAVADRTGRPESAVTALLLGPAPRDDAALAVLAAELADLEAAIALPTRREGSA